MALRLIIFAFVVLTGACGHSLNGVYHTVERGETLYRIGRTYGVDSRNIARANRIRNPQDLRAGQRLFIPGADRVKKVPAVSPPPVVMTPKPASQVSPSPPRTVNPPPLPAVTKKAEPAPRAEVPSAPLPKFAWPVQGKVIRNFNPAGGNPSRGVEIAVPFGTPILSAAPGKVIYSGNGIRGYGNLLILEHENSFFTIYGFNKNNLVRTGAFVGRGEKIALVGRPPEGGGARLHFQVRQGKNVVDPLQYLP